VLAAAVGPGSLTLRPPEPDEAADPGGTGQAAEGDAPDPNR
jgi:hypothetical protein